MTRRPRRPRGGPDPTQGFDFEAPRWREPAVPGDVPPASQRRFRNSSAPEQAGSIDAAGSVPGRADPRDATTEESGGSPS